jgi:D-tyrosyl-tRNA(Tyr) deacylase
MKAWIQRVTEASVEIEGELVSRIGQGYLVLLGVTHTDTEKTADEIADRICRLRIFEDENGKTNRSLIDVGGSVIVVSQFTLYADTSHGRRPGFSHAARPELAEPLYERVVAKIRETIGDDRVGTGRFGAEMKVRLLNDGPFSVELTADGVKGR